MITLALSKGRIFDETVPLLAAAGITVTEDPEKSRKLILPTNQPDVQVVLVRATDVPTYVRVRRRRPGRDRQGHVLIEHGGAGLYQPLDLRIAQCHMAWPRPRVLTTSAPCARAAASRWPPSTPAIARDFFADKGVHVDLIKLYGSMELAPLTGMADAIVDLVSTGKTLKANRLVEVEHIMDISSRLVVNQAALKLKTAPIRRIIDAFAQAIGPAR
jgi:ATP phosphoribosyltransferase